MPITRTLDGVGRYGMRSFPNCRGISVFYGVFLPRHLRGVGLGQKHHHERTQIARAMGFSYSMCTVVETNKIERHIVEKDGYRILDRFRNAYTGNVVLIYGKCIQPEADVSWWARFKRWLITL